MVSTLSFAAFDVAALAIRCFEYTHDIKSDRA